MNSVDILKGKCTDGYGEGRDPRWRMGRSCHTDGQGLPWWEREHLRGFVLCSFCLYCGNVGGTLQISLGFFYLVCVCVVCVCMCFVQTCDGSHWRVLPCLFPMLSSEMVSHWTYNWPVVSRARPVSTSPALEFQVQSLLLAFMWVLGAKLSSGACTPSILPVDPSPNIFI